MVLACLIMWAAPDTFLSCALFTEGVGFDVLSNYLTLTVSSNALLLPKLYNFSIYPIPKKDLGDLSFIQGDQKSVDGVSSG
jgi:hypothetical protein